MTKGVCRECGSRLTYKSRTSVWVHDTQPKWPHAPMPKPESIETVDA